MKSVLNQFFEFSSIKAGAKSLAFIALLVTGLYGSLRVVLGNFGIEADTSHSLMLWYGVSSHGVNWITDWLFTQDNWLLSLVPFHFLGFLIFGPKPSIVILFGWLIFLFSAFVSGSIAWKLGAKKSAVLITLLLLNLGNYAHTSGFASYSTSHNITNLFGLFSIWLIILWMDRPKSIHPFILLVMLTFGAVSDPWMIAAYNLPILIVASLSLIKPTLLFSRQDSIKIALAALVSIVAVKTKLFGIFYFLPSMHFEPGDWNTLNDNAVFLIRDLGGLLNLSFYGQPTDFLPSLISISAIVALFGYIVSNASIYQAVLDKKRNCFFAVSLFSVAGIIAAFLITSVPAKLYSGRFLLNCAYLIIIAICILAEMGWSQFGCKIRIAFVSVVTLFLASSISSNLHEFKYKPFGFKDTGVVETIKFLKSHGLSYGYGPYWGSNANAVTAASKGEVIIRPVTFNRSSGMINFSGRPESSNRWYFDSDVPEGTKEFFVVVKSDGEECPDIQLCLQGLNRQFGSPHRVLSYGNATISVWNHELIGYENIIRIIPHHRYTFGLNGEYVGSKGWHSSEDWGVWSDGYDAVINLELASTHVSRLVFEVTPLLSPSHPKQRVEVKVNGMPANSVMLTPDSGGVFEVAIPEEVKEQLKRSQFLTLQFHLPDAARPVDIGVNNDGRKLAIGLLSLTAQ
ncbi:hypothetical protein [Acidovorax carolinensis]|uniref:hypothetical protein n=1 Tax=Acidovorax carolinensis TaxID=553814 RepID=UPI0012FF9F18|nr:hypothetical protein [Acidovorax carolinensis]